MNGVLADEGQGGAVYVEHRSFKDRGGSQRPQKHLGPNRTNAIRREQHQERQALKSDQARQQQARHSAERAALVAHQASALERKLADLAERERRGFAAIEDAGRGSASQQQATGLRRLFQNLGGREAAPANGTERPETVERQIAALKRNLQAEHAAYVAGHLKERHALDERQTAENRQLTTAATHRVAHDRLREQQERRAQTPEHDQTWERGHSRTP